MEKLIIWIVLLVFFYLMSRINTWKKRAAAAFLVVGQRAITKEERKWGYRNALRAGEKKAERFYVYSALEDFMDEKPMVPFKMKLSNGKKIPAIFIDYYIPKKDWNFITEEQRKFVQMVYDFKNGRVSCSRLFKEALAKLDLPDSVSVVFMPCSNQSKYLTRFSRLNNALSYEEKLHPMLYSLTYLEARESKHNIKDRDKVNADSNIIINADIVGKKVVIIDDVITTGSSIKEHAEELGKYGVEVVGVVCLAKTVKYPEKIEIWIESHFK